MRLLLFFLFLMMPLRAFSAEPFATATVEKGDIVPGQQVHLIVTVFAPDFFTSPPQFPLFDLPNALVTLPEERAQNIVETISGTQYSGIRKRYAIVPEVPGTYAIPAIGIELGYSIDGRSIRTTIITQPVSFTVGGGANATFAARDLSIEQTFDKAPATLKAGDALVRTITITAEDTQAIVIPPLDTGEAAGLGQYARSPKLEDGVSIGRETGSRRIETIVYTAAKDGHFTLPQIDYPWFDTDTKSMKSARLPPVQVEVAPAPARSGIAPDMRPADRAGPFEERRRIMIGVGLFLALAALIWAMRGIPRRFIRFAAVVHANIIASRRYRLRHLRRTILSAELPQVYSALQAWSGSEGFRTLNDWMAGWHPELAADLAALECKLYSVGRSDFDRGKVAKAVGRSSTSAENVRSWHALPELNPGPITGYPKFTRR